MTVGSNPTDRSKLGTKRHILTDKNGIPLAIVITSAASTHDIKAVTDVIDKTVVKRPIVVLLSTIKERKRGQQQQHLCLDRAYNSKSIRQMIIKRGYVPHIPYKRKRGQIETIYQKKRSSARSKRWVVWERTNS